MHCTMLAFILFGALISTRDGFFCDLQIHVTRELKTGARRSWTINNENNREVDPNQWPTNWHANQEPKEDTHCNSNTATQENSGHAQLQMKMWKHLVTTQMVHP